VRAEGTCNNTACVSVTVTVNSISTAATSATATPASVCLGSSSTLTVNGGTLGAGASWQWYSGSCGGTAVGSGASLSVTPAATTTYYVRAEGTCNTTTCVQVTVTVNSLSTAATSASASPTAICPGGSSVLTVSGGSLGTGASWQWYSGSCGGVSVGTGTFISVSPAVTTTYYVRAEGTCNTTTCISVTVTVNSLSTDPTSISASPSAVCLGSSSSLTVNGGSLGTGANWRWYSGSCGGTLIGAGSTISVSPSMATTYYVRAEGSCNTTNCTSVTITVNPLPTITSSAAPTTICNGASSTLTAGGGISYSWDNGLGIGNNLNVSPTSTTTYHVTGSDANSCTNTSLVTVNVNPLPNITALAFPDTICVGASSTLIANGGTSYSWDNGLGIGNPKFVTPASTTTYSVTGTDVNNCKNTATVTVTVNPLPIVTVSSNSPVCGGGTLNLFASGGTIYNWSGPSYTSTDQNPIITPVNGSYTGTYHVTVTDGNSCSSTGSTVVTINSVPELTVTANSPLCSGQDIQLNASSASSYNWTGPGFTSTDQHPIIANAQTTNSGAYYVTITGANGCTNSGSVNVIVNQTPIISAGSDTTIHYGTSTTLNGSASGGSGNDSYSWQPSDSLINANIANPTTVNLEATTQFTLTVIDITTGCHATDDVIITIIGGPLTVGVTANPPSYCVGASTQLNALAGGGSGVYTYTWSSVPAGFNDNTANPIVSPTTTTTYTVTVNDGYNNVTGSVIVTVHPLPTVHANADHTSICQGAQVTLTGSGTATSYVWDNSVTDGLAFTPAGTLTYTVTGTDANSCSNTDQITVTVNPLPTVQANADQTVVCQGTQVTLTGSGTATSYTWNNSVIDGTPFAPSATQTYTVTGTDANGCIDTNQITITVNPVYLYTENHNICAGNSYTWHSNIYSTTGTYYDSLTTTLGCDSVFVLNLNVVPNYQFVDNDTVCNGQNYLWHGSLYTITGTYYDSLVSSGGCDSVYVLNLTVNPSYLYTEHDTICNGSSYLWHSNTYTTAGIYYDSLTTTLGCDSIFFLNLIVNPTYTFNENHSICTGNSYTWHSNIYSTTGTYYDSLITTLGCDSVFVLNLNVVPNYQFVDNDTVCNGQNYLWHGSLYTIAGTYYDSLVSSGGCDSVYVLNLTVNPSYLYTEHDTICNGSSYLWHGNTYTLAGIYYDSLTTTLGCDSIFVLNLTVNPTYTFNENHSICTGNSYTWHGNIYNTAGIYYDSLLTTTGCDSIFMLNLSETLPPTVSITANPDTICAGSSSILSAGGANSYVWSTTDTTTSITVNPTNTTLYSVIGTNNGCSDTTTITIIVKPLPTITITANPPAVCQGSNVVLTAIHADSYVWSTTEITPSITVTPQQTTTYSVTGTLNGCSDTANITVIIYTPDNLTNSITICQGEKYSWNGTQYDTAGTYILNLHTSHGCDSILTLNLNVNPKPIITVTNSDTLVLIGNSTTLTAQGADTYQWIPSSALNCDNCSITISTPDTTITYCVVGTNTFGCSDTACIVVNVDNDCGQLFLPLAFSPNGDGKNDVWKIRGRCIKSFELRIFDRWGEKVFETVNPNEGWDGTFNGKALGSDVYVFFVTITMRNGEVKNLKGDITILR
jgi:gliding motility-associated-like protein